MYRIYLDLFHPVYSSPEAGLTTNNQPSSNILNKFAGRKSGRQRQIIKQSRIIFLSPYATTF